MINVVCVRRAVSTHITVVCFCPHFNLWPDYMCLCRQYTPELFYAQRCHTCAISVSRLVRALVHGFTGRCYRPEASSLLFWARIHWTRERFAFALLLNGPFYSCTGSSAPLRAGVSPLLSHLLISARFHSFVIRRDSSPPVLRGSIHTVT